MKKLCLIAALFICLSGCSTNNKKQQEYTLSSVDDDFVFVASQVTPNSNVSSDVIYKGLDSFWDGWIKYQSNSTDMEQPFVTELEIEAKEELNCLYISYSAINEMNSLSKELDEYLIPRLEDDSIDYLKFYSQLKAQNTFNIPESVKIHHLNPIENNVPYIVGEYRFFSVVKEYNVINSNLELAFLKGIQYTNNNNTISFKNESFEKENKKVLYYNFDKLLKTNNKYCAFGRLRTYSFDIVFEEKKIIKEPFTYRGKILAENEHYYDELESTFINKSFISSHSYIDDKKNEYVDASYIVTCDYLLLKRIFGL